MELFNQECWLIRNTNEDSTYPYFSDPALMGQSDAWTDIEDATRYRTQEEAEDAARGIPRKRYAGFKLQTVHVQISIETVGDIEARDVPTPTGGAR